MNSKKTIYMWLVIFLIAISLYETYKSVGQVFRGSAENISNIVLGISLFLFVYIIVGVVYIYKLFVCKKGVFIWTNIYFPILVIWRLLDLFSNYISSQNIQIISISIVQIIVLITIWIGFYKHLKKAETSGLISLN